MQPVVSEGNMGKPRIDEPRVGFRVRQFMRDMREPRAARPEFADQRERLFDGLMHGMRRVTQRIQH